MAAYLIISYIFDIISLIILVDAWMSWFNYYKGTNYSIPTISEKLKEIYTAIGEKIPTKINWIDLSPVLVLVLLNLVQNLLVRLFLI